tara:strand:+ start:2660 stop:8605 length:5946 start_codon:yes stop_codon:yes gene_type:complete
MAIDKRIPRVLNSDADNKTVNKVSMSDALNLYSGPDNEGFDATGKKLDAGKDVLKNIRGNVAVDAYPGEGLPSDARVLGSVEDVRTDITYLFVYSVNGDNHGVWAYDKKDILSNAFGGESTGNPVLRLIYKSSQFNFPQNGFVKGDIVYSNASRSFEDEDLDKDVIIYFTDGVNEPRKINAYRAFVESEGENINGSDIYAEADFITACPKTPLVPIEFVFQNEPDRSTSNFERTRGFQFAYQSIYKDGAESAISSYSDVAFPPSILDQGSQTYVNHSDFNKCVLTIPAQGPEIEKVRLLCREGNDGSFLIIDELDAGVTSFNFFNDRILKGVSTNEVNKQFDSIPRNAVAQTVSSNRLMYGNYLDGFNKSTTTATATVIYKNRPEDFIAYTINVVPSIFSPKFGQGVSFFMDFQEMPDSLPADTIVNVSVTLTPDTNFHFFHRGNGGGVGQTRQSGPQIVSSNNEGLFSGINSNQGNALTSSQVGVSNFNDGEIFGGGSGFYQVSGVNTYNSTFSNYWKYAGPTTLNGVSMQAQQTISVGSSAAHPLIIKGSPITFSVSLEITEDLSDAQAKLNLAVREAFINKNIDSSTFQANPQPFVIPDFGITILQNNCTPSYSFDLGLNSGNTIKQPYVGKSDSDNDSRNKLINAAYGGGGAADPFFTSGDSGVPVGYFIFNKGKATWMLSENSQEVTDALQDTIPIADSYFNYDPSTSSHFMLHLVAFSDVEALTCLHDTAPDTQTAAALSWIVISEEDVIEFGSNIDSWLDQVGIGSDQIHGFANNPYGENSEARVTKGYGYQLGYVFPSTNYNQESYTGANPFADYSNQRQYISHSYFASAGYDAPTASFLFGDGVPVQGLGLGADLVINPIGIIADGEGGPGGGPARSFDSENDYDRLKMSAQGSVTVNPYEKLALGPVYDNAPDYLLPFVEEYKYEDTVFYGGRLRPTGEVQIVIPPSSPNPEIDPDGADLQTFDSLSTTLPFLQRNVGGTTNYIHQLPEAAANGTSLTSDSVDFSRQQSSVELNKTVSFASGSFDFGGVESFKTEANHDFGIVYYDERGRHGFVDYLTTAFVEGYTNEERGLGNDGKGAVEVSLQLTGTPPDWAHSYKIVYGENSTVQDFVQYSAGGAFVGGNPDNVEISDFNKNIYVSLNYLQGHPVSYVNAFGARTQEGGLNLYKFEEGDKLRVISYFDGSGINYKDYEFDVVDLVVLGDGQNETNPLSNNPEQNQQGEFLVIKDNPEAFGFSHADVLSDLHNWGKNCIVEIRTPKKSIDVEDQIYYEISDHYKVVKNNSGNLVHDVNPVVVKNGDVWFRPVATNIREFENGEYVDIISDDDGADPAPQPNFKNVFLETRSATDLFKSDSFSRGRPNVIFEDAAETKREATITYSDPSNPESFRIRYSSFNSSLANFKDLSDRYGDIEYIANHNDYIVVIQKEKVSIVPVNKNVLSDASGNQQIIASLNVLGEVIAYPGVSGCDNDPSSVYDSGEQVYFCNKSLSKVYRFTRQSGVEEISEKGMSSLIRASLQKAIELGDNVRVVGGYDTLKEEYLLSIVNIPVRTTGFVEEVVQEAQEDDVTFEEFLPTIQITPDDILDFGELDPTNPVPQGQVMIENVGLGDLIITDLEINDGEAINFELVSPNANVSVENPMVIQPNGSETILISIVPPGEDGAIDSFLEIYSNDPETPILELPLTVFFKGSEVDDESDSEALVLFTQAYNELYGTDLTEEDMSKELAFNYLKDLEGTTGEPSLKDLRNFMNDSDNDDITKLRFDVGNNENIGSADLLVFLGMIGDEYDEDAGMFSGLLPATSTPPPPKAAPPPPSKPKPSTTFKSVDDAIAYLFVQNELTVGEYHLLRAQISDNFSLNLNEQGPINNYDLIKFLTVYGSTTDPNELAFETTPTGEQGGIPVGPSSLETILWLIDDATMTVAQYFYLASYIKLTAKADANEDNLLTTADLLIFMGVWGFGASEGTSYDLNDPAFNL